ncbi:uncharacterized protein AMSG_09321 [Thecamonas trahens ATCC 50062]|uniref:Ankyrin repeat protein n=1 Tax=Thecamonas trahens ATCC 50062 TaxID=461836 RepID=A0A0L0DKZ8_THETB|nr:hypothetical protein AMSG_09321 [Thecamonas trahens ATCC 50062]KNC53029.1 hypothetical protein AMSG_09321 [Thecamonas trahens ATCC 50062]|eukprot:XP_013754707.1 hypothetical protein AMSG_09321 [Thecamonas trahens ATCC 50062]
MDEYGPVFGRASAKSGCVGCAAVGLGELAPELLHAIAFGSQILAPRDIVALARSCRYVRDALLGAEYSVDCAKARFGAGWCLQHSEWRAARLALGRIPRLVDAVAALVDVVQAELESGDGGFPAWLRLMRGVLAVPGVVHPSHHPHRSSAGDRLPLTLACAAGNVAAVEELLEHDVVDPAACDNAALMSAATAPRHAGVIVAVLVADGRVDAAARLNYAVRHAARVGNADAVRHLLGERGVDPAADGNYALQMAAESGHTEVVAVLVADGRVDVHVGGDFPARVAAECGHVSTLEVLLAAGADPTGRNNAALRLAAAHGHTRVVKTLLADPRVDPSTVDNYAIKWAAANGHTDVVALLLSHAAVNPAADDNFAIRLAAENGRIETLKELLADPRVDPSSDGSSAMLWAIDNGHQDVVDVLLADGRTSLPFNINVSLAVATRVRSPLHSPTFAASTEVVFLS